MLSNQPSGALCLGLTLVGLEGVATFLWHLVAAGHGGQGFAPLNALERYAYDVRLRLSAREELDPRVVIVDVDETSLREVGQWPWSRSVLATLLDRLFDDYSVDTVVFDVVFAEPESRYGSAEIEAAAKAHRDSTSSLIPSLEALGGDARLASAMSGRSVVLGYFFEQSDVESVGMLPPELEFADVPGLSAVPEMRRYSGNLPRLQRTTEHGGFFSLSAVTDPDGVVRRVSLLNSYQGKLYPALSLAAVMRFLGVHPDPILAQTDAEAYPSLETLDIGISQIPLDAEAAVHVPYHEPQGAFRYLSAASVLSAELENPAALAGTIALVGTTAAGLRDARNTPLENGFPGVEIHATLISAMLDGDFRQQPAWTLGFNLLLTGLLGVFLAWMLPRSTVTGATLLTVVVLSALLAGNAWFWRVEQWVVPVAAPLTMVLMLYSLNTVVGFFAESRSRRIMRRMFGLYVPPEIVDEMSSSPDIYSLKSERREMTVLFSDVRDFTSISETLSPEALSKLLNTLLTPLTEIIHHHHGAIDKYMGDAVMAFWGAPVVSRSHAHDAVSAALEIVHRLETLNKAVAQKGWPRMELGVGLSTGEMSIGNMGSEFRMAYTVLGDSVNLGSRLEGLTKYYGEPIVVSEATCEAAPAYLYLELDLVRVKGKQRPERIFAPLALCEQASREIINEVKACEQALDAYRARKWDRAKAGFTALAANSRPLYRLYLKRIRHYQTSPPPTNWDGVNTMLEK